MFLLNLPRPEQLELWADTKDPAGGGEPVSNFVYVLVLVIALCGGALHGIAMAIRKKYGEGKEKYWLEWKWWVGTVADGFAGFMIWPAMPFVSVQILVPLIIATQLGSSYICGLVLFQEKCQLNHTVGLILCVIGIIGISLSTSHEASHFTISQFWSGFVSPRFVWTTLFSMLALAGSYLAANQSTFYALLCGFFEGLQYICSRSIVDSIFEKQLGFLTQPAVLGAVVLKGSCILGIIYFQQLGLEADLSTFAGIYLVGCVLFTCVYGWAFFGDAMPLSISFFLSAFSTLAGIWLLNQSHDLVSGEKEAEKGKDGAVASPQDNVNPQAA